MKQRKGSSFERDVCRRLSLWWTHGARDDVFWRTAGSGARATVRSRAGRGTAGHYGDIAASDPLGSALIDCLTVELKRGYAGATLHDLLDRPSRSAVQPFEQWLLQAIESHEAAGSLSWAVISRRDRRLAWIWMPYQMYASLRRLGALAGRHRPAVGVEVVLRLPDGPRPQGIFGTTLHNFLVTVSPDHIRALSEG